MGERAQAGAVVALVEKEARLLARADVGEQAEAVLEEGHPGELGLRSSHLGLSGVPKNARLVDDEVPRREDLAHGRLEISPPGNGPAGRQLEHRRVAVHVEQRARAAVALGVHGPVARGLGRQAFLAELAGPPRIVPETARRRAPGRRRSRGAPGSASPASTLPGRGAVLRRPRPRRARPRRRRRPTRRRPKRARVAARRRRLAAGFQGEANQTLSTVGSHRGAKIHPQRFRLPAP